MPSRMKIACDECGDANVVLLHSAGFKICVPCSTKCDVRGCSCSTGIHEDDTADGSAKRPWGLTFGSGTIDEWGYWRDGCPQCARAAEIRDKVPFNSYWPHIRGTKEKTCQITT